MGRQSAGRSSGPGSLPARCGRPRSSSVLAPSIGSPAGALMERSDTSPTAPARVGRVGSDLIGPSLRASGWYQTRARPSDQPDAPARVGPTERSDTSPTRQRGSARLASEGRPGLLGPDRTLARASGWYQTRARPSDQPDCQRGSARRAVRYQPDWPASEGWPAPARTLIPDPFSRVGAGRRLQNSWRAA